MLAVPLRAPRCATENFPKPVIATSSPARSVDATVARNASMALAASLRARPLSWATGVDQFGLVHEVSSRRG